MNIFNDFTKFKSCNSNLSFDRAFIKWKQQYKTPPLSTQSIVLPYISKLLPDTESITSKSGGTFMKFEYDNKRNKSPIMELQDSVETQAAAAAEQLISNYLVENPADYIIEEMPDLFNTTLPPSPPPPPPSPVTKPVEPAKTTKPTSPAGRKNIETMKEIHDAQKLAPAKRRKVANILPNNNEDKRSVGRPTKNETLTKIANESIDKNIIISKELILYATVDGSEKKKKTVLTRSTENIELYNANHYSCYEFITDLRKKSLDKIKEQKNILDKLIYMEKMLEANIKSINEKACK